MWTSPITAFILCSSQHWQRIYKDLKTELPTNGCLILCISRSKKECCNQKWWGITVEADDQARLHETGHQWTIAPEHLTTTKPTYHLHRRDLWSDRGQHLFWIIPHVLICHVGASCWPFVGSTLHCTELPCTAQHCSAQHCIVLHCLWLLFFLLQCLSCYQ